MEYIFYSILILYRGASKSLAQTTSRCILFDGENISFDVVIEPFFGRTVEPRISRICDRISIYFYV